MQGFSVRLNKSTADAIRRIAEHEGLAMGQLVRSILIKFVRTREDRKEDPK
jgi:predicted DNA-binding ribbon-helix-helix protein